MKVLFLTNGYPPRHVAGTEVSTAAVATALAQLGHEVAVACAGTWDVGPRPLNGSETNNEDGVAVTRFHLNWQRGPNPNRYLVDNPETALAVGKLIRRLTPDIVHVTSCYTLSASVLRETRARGVPCVVTLTDYWFLCPRVTLLRSDGTSCSGDTTPAECLDCMLADSPAYRRLRPSVRRGVSPLLREVSRRPWFARRRGLRGRAFDFDARKPLLLDLLASVDSVLAPTTSLAARYSKLGLEREIRLWRFGHDLRWVEGLERRPHDSRLVFGFVGRIAEEKGLHILLAAAALLRDAAPAAEVHVWGDPEQEPFYTARCRALALDGVPVRFRGRFDRGRLADVYAELDVLVVPSIWDENSPLVVFEAFAAGAPVIAADVTGLSEVIAHGTDGLLVPPRDPAALAEAIARLARDETLLAALRSGIQPVRSAGEAAAELLDLYSELLV